MSESVEIRVMGQQLRLRTDLGENYAHQLARHVEKVAGAIQKSTLSASSDRTMLMAALQIADELFQLKEQSLEERRQRNDLYQRLIATSEKLLKEA